MSRSAVCAVVLLVIALVDFSSAGNVELVTFDITGLPVDVIESRNLEEFTYLLNQL